MGRDARVDGVESIPGPCALDERSGPSTTVSRVWAGRSATGGPIAAHVLLTSPLASCAVLVPRLGRKIRSGHPSGSTPVNEGYVLMKFARDDKTLAIWPLIEVLFRDVLSDE